MALCAWNLPPSALPGISPTRGEIAEASARSTIGGERQAISARDLANAANLRPSPSAFPMLISPLVGEMPGRAEGGSPLSAKRGGADAPTNE
ncbi:hypothetical protein BHMPCIPO_03236 [Ensifer sesbaniae]|nr:hypothetical protein [Ensifer sesbaniae]